MVTVHVQVKQCACTKVIGAPNKIFSSAWLTPVCLVLELASRTNTDLQSILPSAADFVGPAVQRI